MDDVFFARTQMGVSLAFHIVFAAVGIAMPLLMVLAEARWRRTGDPDALALSKVWAKGTAVLFAVGAVSGTVLSFELGLLFPAFMRHAGPVIGMPFSLEGFAFFTEAIFLGMFLYGRDRMRPALHVASGVLVALSGVASAIFVTIANAWMNAPRGFRVEDGRFVDIDPIAAMQSPFVLHEVTHTVLAAYAATAFGVAGIHALGLLRHPTSRLHAQALGLALALAIPSALAQPIVGHYAGVQVAKHQPLKLAAMEGLRETQANAPLHVGPVAIPGGLSYLAFGRTDAVVTGLEDFPRADWPHGTVRFAFQAMVGIGTVLVGLAVWAVVDFWRRRRGGRAHCRWLLRALVFASPLGFIAMEAGWMVTEMGRQPWAIYDVMRTVDAVTPVRGLVVPFVLFTSVYVGLAVAVVVILRRHVRATIAPPDEGTAP